MTTSTNGTHGLRVAIIGGGPGGLCMAKRLLDEGYRDFVLLERNGGVGGTWYQNRYPGCECDVQSALYSFSFEFKADWSKPYGRQPEILAYMEHIAEKYGILPTAGSAPKSPAPCGTTNAPCGPSPWRRASRSRPRWW